MLAYTGRISKCLSISDLKSLDSQFQTSNMRNFHLSFSVCGLMLVSVSCLSCSNHGSHLLYHSNCYIISAFHSTCEIDCSQRHGTQSQWFDLEELQRNCSGICLSQHLKPRLFAPSFDFNLRGSSNFGIIFPFESVLTYHCIVRCFDRTCRWWSLCSIRSWGRRGVSHPWRVCRWRGCFGAVASGRIAVGCIVLQ